jgi:hypothetical protein
MNPTTLNSMINKLNNQVKLLEDRIIALESRISLLESSPLEYFSPEELKFYLEPNEFMGIVSG